MVAPSLGWVEEGLEAELLVVSLEPLPVALVAAGTGVDSLGGEVPAEPETIDQDGTDVQSN